MTTYQSIYWELGDSGLKIMSALVNKIYMSGDWSKNFVDVTMIACRPRWSRGNVLASRSKVRGFKPD